MGLTHQLISGRSEIESMKRVVCIFMVTTVLALDTTAARLIDWPIVWASAIISTSALEKDVVPLSPNYFPRHMPQPYERLIDNLLPKINESTNDDEHMNLNSSRQRKIPPENIDSANNASDTQTLKGLTSQNRKYLLTNSIFTPSINIKSKNGLNFKLATRNTPVEINKVDAHRRSLEIETCPKITESVSCKCSELSVNCDRLNTTFIQFPRPLPKEVRHLSIEQNNLHHIPILDGATCIKELSLARNFISLADVKNLGNLISLEKLDISMNELVVFDISTDSLQYLQFLNLSHNKLDTIEPLPSSLTHLYVKENYLSDVDFLKYCQHLQIIDLSFNHIQFIPSESFQDIKGLVYIDLRYNQIQNTDFLYFIPRTLVTLKLSNNFIDKIPTNAFRNKYLVYLHLESNFLSDVSFIIYLNVAELYLSNNPLRILNKKHFESRILLRILDLSNTSLTSIDFVYSIPRLIRLQVEDNNISCIPKNFIENYTSLRYWFLRNNPLETIKCSVTPRWIQKPICNISASHGEISLSMKDENINNIINCVLSNREYIQHCEQTCNSASQILIPLYLLLSFAVLKFQL